MPVDDNHNMETDCMNTGDHVVMFSSRWPMCALDKITCHNRATLTDIPVLPSCYYFKAM